MQLRNNYRLLRFLNREHGGISRYSFGTLGWLGTLASTRSIVLANAMFAEFVADKYSVAVHKAVRHVRHWSRRLDAVDNALFDFTVETDPAERRALEGRLQKLRSRLSETEYLTDLLFIKAADVHHILEQKKPADNEIAAFYELANVALAKIAKTQTASAENHDRARTVDKFDKASAVAALQDIAELLPLEQWPWYVVSGTFLGLHREGGFLAHDYDIDLGINAEDIDVELLQQALHNSDQFIIKELGYHIEVIGDAQQGRYARRRLGAIKVMHNSGVQVDFFVHYTEDGSCWHGTLLHRWDNTPFRIVRRKLEGVTVYAPEAAELYLTENYGNWRTPVTEYDCTTDTPNMTVSRNLYSRSFFIKRYAHLAEKDSRQAARLKATLEHTGVLISVNGQAKLAAL